MPTYEYVCKSCDHAFEKFQGITEKVLRKCPECGERKLQRLIGAGSGLLFKGDGFYITDYRSESYKKAKSSENESTKKNDSDSSKKPSSSEKKKSE